MTTRHTLRQRYAALLAGSLLASSLLSACDKPKTVLGEGSSEVTGSAGPAGALGAARALVKCDAPVATLALAETREGYDMLTRYNLPPSPLPLVRLIVQQSGCFRLMDRAAGLSATIREQELKDAGVLRREGSTLQKGRGLEAHYTLVPTLAFSEKNAGRDIAGLLGQIPVLRDFGVLLGIVEQAKFAEAQAVLLLTDNETTEQIAAATGSARATDIGMGGLLLGRLGGAGQLGWSNTNEGKVIAAAFLDAHNALVAQVRQMQARPLPPTPGRSG